jgi:hypothetical protein
MAFGASPSSQKFSPPRRKITHPQIVRASSATRSKLEKSHADEMRTSPRGKTAVVSSMALEALNPLAERKYTPQELAKEYGLHVMTIRRLFFHEPGVIRIGHPTLQYKRQHYTLRIPASVVRRVFGELAVKEKQ